MKRKYNACYRLRKKGFNISDNIFTIDEAKKELLSILKANTVEEE